MSIDVCGGLAYGYYLTQNEVETILASCSEFEQELLYDSWLIPLDHYEEDCSEALFAVKLRAADQGTAAAIDKDSIEPGLAVQMMADFRKYGKDIAMNKNDEPKFYVYTQIS